MPADDGYVHTAEIEAEGVIIPVRQGCDRMPLSVHQDLAAARGEWPHWLIDRIRSLPLTTGNGFVLALRASEFVLQRAAALEVGREVG